ncbi:hypothetical protein BGZ54_009247 [Gamsiella multidivaricata]|nr:hypothetical protein BGZ54_009247 [Gamsiella multidivaricata]
MAANFWTSSHATHWILDRRRLEEAMREDLEYVDIATLTKIKMWYYNNHGGFDYDTFKVAEFEFYLLEELEFYLTVYHPYRDLTLIAKELKLEESNLQTAWFVINDSYRTDVCLLYAPHMIALAALYIICVVHAERYTDSNNNNNNSNKNALSDDSSSSGGIISHTHSNVHLHSQLHNMATKKGHHHNTSHVEGHGINNRNMVQWFADLNVEVEEVGPYVPDVQDHRDYSGDAVVIRDLERL